MITALCILGYLLCGFFMVYLGCKFVFSLEDLDDVMFLLLVGLSWPIVIPFITIVVSLYYLLRKPLTYIKKFLTKVIEKREGKK